MHHANMFNFIQKMHGKSESQRRLFAVGVSLVVVLIIFGTWLSIRIKTSQAEIARLREHSSSPFTALTQNMASMFSSFKDSTSALGKAVGDEVGKSAKEIEQRAAEQAAGQAAKNTVSGAQSEVQNEAQN